MKAAVRKRTQAMATTAFRTRDPFTSFERTLPANQYRNQSAVGKQNKKPSYGRLFARIAMPSASQRASRVLELLRILPSPPTASPPPIFAPAHPHDLLHK